MRTPRVKLAEARSKFPYKEGDTVTLTIEYQPEDLTKARVRGPVPFKIDRVRSEIDPVSGMPYIDATSTDGRNRAFIRTPPGMIVGLKK